MKMVYSMQCKRKETHMHGSYTTITYCHANSFKALKTPTYKLSYPANQLGQEKLKERKIKG